MAARRFRSVGNVTVLAIAAAFVATLGPANAAHGDTTEYGCPFGAVCIHPTEDPATSNPEYVFWS